MSVGRITAVDNLATLVISALDGDALSQSQVDSNSAGWDWGQLVTLVGSREPAKAENVRELAAMYGWKDPHRTNGKHARGQKRPLTIKPLLEGDPPPAPRQQVDRFTLAGDINVTAGMGDSGKSTTLFALCVSTVTGRPLFGSLRVNNPGPVVLIVPEDGEAVARHHVDAITAGLEPPLSEVERAAIERDLYIIGDERRVNLLTDTAELAELMRDIRPAVVIADPISDLIGGENENDEAVANAVCANLRLDIARPLGSAVVLAAHVRKQIQGSTDKLTVNDLKGSAGWANHARLVWLVSKPKGGDLITYTLAKSNRLQTGLEHQVKLAIDADSENAAHWLSCRLTDANLGASSETFTPGIGRAVNENERKALEALDDKHEPGKRLSFSAWFKQSGLANDSTFKNVIRRLQDAQLATAIPTGKKARNGGNEYAYAISDGGKAALETGWNR